MGHGRDSFGADRTGEPVPVRIAPLGLDGLLGVPADPSGVVLFAHGSGSSRFSPRNAFVAQALRRAGLATLAFDLLDEQEAADRRNVFDIPLLAGRLAAATEWAALQPPLRGLPTGYFGASTGAAAALVAAADLGVRIAAVVSRGGRPDMAADSLPLVVSPTLLLVGGRDREVLRLNELALARLRCVRQLCVVPGATHLFEEPGTLEAVVGHVREWFERHLTGGLR